MCEWVCVCVRAQANQPTECVCMFVCTRQRAYSVRKFENKQLWTGMISFDFWALKPGAHVFVGFMYRERTYIYYSLYYWLCYMNVHQPLNQCNSDDMIIYAFPVKNEIVTIYDKIKRSQSKSIKMKFSLSLSLSLFSLSLSLSLFICIIEKPTIWEKSNLPFGEWAPCIVY